MFDQPLVDEFLLLVFALALVPAVDLHASAQEADDGLDGVEMVAAGPCPWGFVKSCNWFV